MKLVKTKREILTHPAVQSLHQEDDGCWERPGWWCYLKPGFISDMMECGTIHEPTIAGVCDVINSGISIQGGGFFWKDKWVVRKLSSFETETLGPLMTRKERSELYRSSEFKNLIR